MQNDKSKFKKEFLERLINFSLEVIKFCEDLRSNRVLWVVIDQLVDSSTSIGANVFEAKSSSSKRDYIKYFEIALKSANETIYWLIIVKNINPNNHKSEKLLKEAKEIANILASSVLTLKGKKNPNNFTF